VTHIDASGLHVLTQMHRDSLSLGFQLLIAGVQAKPLYAMEKADVTTLFGAENLHPDLTHALQALRVIAPAG